MDCSDVSGIELYVEMKVRLVEGNELLHCPVRLLQGHMQNTLPRILAANSLDTVNSRNQARIGNGRNFTHPPSRLKLFSTHLDRLGMNVTVSASTPQPE